MPIYEYLCNSCGYEKEHLQKMNDAAITICPACGSNHYIKLISAAGFQLKGSGWYVTDFKNNKTSKPETKRNTGTEVKNETITAGAGTTNTSTSNDASAANTISSAD